MSSKALLALIVSVLTAGIAVGELDMGHMEPESVTATCAFSSASVSWAPVSDAHRSGYDVYRMAASETTYTKANFGLVTTTQYTVSGLSTGIAYDFRVVAVYGDGHVSVMSAAARCITG